MVKDEFEHLESKINYSKLPSGFLNFDQIEILPPKALAYTAHLAGRMGMDNQDLWIRLRDAFVESLDSRSMKPKFIAQCVLALSRREEMISAKTVSHVLRVVAHRVSEFRPVDLVLIFHSLTPASTTSNESYQNSSVRLILRHLAASDLNTLTPKSVAVLFGAIGKLGVKDDALIDKLCDLVIEGKESLDAFEVAAVIRTLSSLQVRTEKCRSVLIALLDSANLTSFEPGPINIILHALWQLANIVPAETVGRVFSQLSASLLLAEADLLPHLLQSCCGLVGTHDVHGLNLCLRLASAILRQYKQLKPVSLPVAVEGLKILCAKFPGNQDVHVSLASATRLTQSVVDRYLLLAPEEERRDLVTSKYCRYSPWLEQKVRQSLVCLNAPPGPEDSVTPLTLEGVIAGASQQVDPVELVRQLRAAVDNGDAIEPLTAVQTLWLLHKADSLGVDSVSGRLVDVIATASGPLPNPFYSVVFRLAHARDELNLPVAQLLRIFVQDSRQCDIRTICRALQVLPRVKGDEDVVTDHIIALAVSRIREVETKDLCGFLKLLLKLNVRFNDPHKLISQYVDLVEAKIAVDLTLVKSFSRRSEVQSIGRLLGLSSPVDLIDEFEDALAQERVAKQVRE